MDLKYLLLLAALVYVCSAAKKAKVTDPEKAKMLALQRQKLQYHKQKVLAPYNEGKGVQCANHDENKNKANTCIFVGSYCGFYCECPKCQCIHPDHVGVEIDGVRECMPGNLDPVAISYYSFDENADTSIAKTCRVSAQCKSNLECSPVGTSYSKYCICPLNMKWNVTLELCQPPDAEYDACDPTVGCGFGPAVTSPLPAVQSYIGHFCQQDNATHNIYRCHECDVPNCRECSQGGHCSLCDHGFRLQKGTGVFPRGSTTAAGTSDACVECAAAYCKRCDSQTALTFDDTVSPPATGYDLAKVTSAACDECLDGYFKDSTNKYTCTKKVQYQRPCKGEADECETEGAECRSVNGNKMCTCKAGYTWNPSGCFCVHPDADLNVEVNRTCKYDRKNFKNDDSYFKNDASLKVCKAGLECVDSCSPCAGCPGQTVCVTPIPYPEPPCANKVLTAGGGSSSGGGSSDNAGGSSAGAPAGGSAGAGAGSGSEGGKSAGERTATSLTALLGSLALASLFW